MSALSSPIQRLWLVLISCSVILVFSGAAHAGANADKSSELLERLRQGGLVLVLRHGDSPHDQSAAVGLSKDCRLGEGRGLSAKGLARSRRLGSLLVESDVALLKAYTSRMCRSWDTAQLIAGAASVIPAAAQMTTDPAIIAEFKKEIEIEISAHPGQNIMLVSHSNIAPLYGAYAADDEAEVPSGYVFVVDPNTWNALGRFTTD